MKNNEKNGLPEIYQFFRQKFTKKERDNPAFLEYRRFSLIIKDFNQELTKLLIEEAVEFKIPLRLGYVRIKKYKKKIRLNPDGTIDKSNQSVNWKETKLLWNREYPGLTSLQLKEIHGKPLVYYLNEHTDGFGFLLYWNKKGSNAINRSLYSMVFTFSNNRYLANILKGNKKIEYYE